MLLLTFSAYFECILPLMFLVYWVWVVDYWFETFPFSNMFTYCYQFSTQHCFSCVPKILVCFIFIFIWFNIFSSLMTFFIIYKLFINLLFRFQMFDNLPVIFIVWFTCSQRIYCAWFQFKKMCWSCFFFFMTKDMVYFGLSHCVHLKESQLCHCEIMCSECGLCPVWWRSSSISLLIFCLDILSTERSVGFSNYNAFENIL